MRHLLIVVIGILCTNVNGQIDVINYSHSITVNDENDTIYGTSFITLEFTEDCKRFSLDLVGIKNDGKGMKVSDVRIRDKKLTPIYRHEGDKLFIEEEKGKKGTSRTYVIDYKGVPIDGLIIGKNKHGNRTFFGDNWPNRAHNWFPCNDHPSDKATIGFMVIAPAHYNCVANGRFIVSNEAPNPATGKKQKYFQYHSDIPLPTKVMVIGLAEFSYKTLKTPTDKNSFPHTAWVYPEDESSGFSDMSVAVDPLKFFIENIGPYPYEKLDHVQSTTRFGGMENAGCIFYDEDAVDGEGTMENLLAHEIAHQWFGNSATESDWPHIWLSEGFATYFTSLHLENKYGRDRMNEQLVKDRDRVIKFSKSYLTPIIDTVSTDLMYLLNPNSYQKGCWALHMLRNKIGDENFWNGIRNYYDTYKYGNASSNDFIRVMESTSKMSLQLFFDQWLRESGHPLLRITLEKEVLRIEQTQTDQLFSFPIEIEFTTKDGKKIVKAFEVANRLELFKIKDLKGIKSFEIDPNVNLLFEEVN